MSTSPESQDWMVLQCRSCGTRMKTRREAAHSSRLLCPKCRQPVASETKDAEETNESAAEAVEPQPAVEKTTPSPIPAAPKTTADSAEFSPAALPARPAPSGDSPTLPAPGAVRNPSSFQGGTSMRGGGGPAPSRGPVTPGEAARHPSFDGFLPTTPAGEPEPEEEPESSGPRRLRRDTRRKRIERGRKAFNYDELADWDSTDLASMPDAEADADIWDKPSNAPVSAYESDEREFIVEEIDEHGNKVRKRKKVRRSRILKGARLFFQRLSTGSRYAVIGLAALTGCAGVYGLYVLQQRATDPEPGPPRPEIQIDRTIMTSADFEGSMSAVRDFLAADGVEAKLAFVRQPERMRPLMAKWYRDGHTATPLGCGEAVNMDKTKDRDSYFVLLSVPVVSPDPLAPGSFVETPNFFAVEEVLTDGKSSYLIDWEVSTAYQEMPLDTFMSTMPKEPHIFRVKIKEGGYYNHDFTEDKWLCAELYYPGRDFSLVGYIDRASPRGRELMSYATGEARSSLVLELMYPENAVSRNQVIITKLVHPSWFFATEKEAEKALAP